MEDEIIEQLIERLPPARSFGEAYNKLIKAFRECDVDTLLEFLKLGINPNVTLFDGHSPLTLLISTSTSSRWQDTAKLLLEFNSNPNKRTPKGTPVISQLVASGEPDLVSLILDKGADIEATGPSGETALLTAVHYKQVPCLKVLLKRGANPNVKSLDGNSAIMWAAGRSNGIGSPKCLAAVKSLLEYGADPSVPNDRGYTPLMAAALIRESETVRTLIKAGADLESQDARGETALFKAVYSNCPESVKILVEAGANANARCNLKRTPLMVVSTYSILETLIHYCNDINARDNDGFSALHHYAAANQSQFLRLLLIFGADIEAQDKMGNVPLQIAMRARSRDCISFLLSKGSKATAKNNKDVTLFHELIVPWDFFQTMDIFPMVNTPSLLMEIQNYLAPSSELTIELIQTLISEGGLCDAATHDGVTPLMLAALCRDHRLCKVLLIEGEADPQAVDNCGRNVLAYACRGGDLSIVKLITKLNSCVNCVDKDGNLPIFYAAQFLYEDIVLFLLLDLAFYMKYNVNVKK
ncbi:Ankyrin repeat-containing domain [Trinorchestia longiramus]|nr:Ankyrin repeat-containing domain [Trinorchestia longiramus]